MCFKRTLLAHYRSYRTLTALVGATIPGLVACADNPVEPERPLTKLPRPLTAGENAVIHANNGFAFELLREVAEPGKNVFVSPLSVSMTLGMALNGAAGGTFEAMRSGLRLPDLAMGEINEGYRGVRDLLFRLDPSVQIAVANSVWMQQGYTFEARFSDAIRTHFDARAQTLDFADPGAKQAINGWVKDQTRGRIESIIQEIDQGSILFLLNAVYFEGDWTVQFDPAKTRPRPFFLEGSTDPVDVPTMSEPNGRGATGSTETVQIAELPYGAEAFSMVILQPRSEGSLAGLVNSIDLAQWNAWTNGVAFDKLPVQMPTFKLEHSVLLNTPLVKMGMGMAFDSEAADFSRLTSDIETYISQVKHKTFLQVDEEGTVAAAVTSAGIQPIGVPSGIVVNRPFLLAIRERLSGTILFLGAIYDPR